MLLLPSPSCLLLAMCDSDSDSSSPIRLASRIHHEMRAAKNIVWDEAIMSEAFEASSRAALLTAAAESLWEADGVITERKTILVRESKEKVPNELLVERYIEIAKAQAAMSMARRVDLAVPSAFLELLNNMQPRHASGEGAYPLFKEKVDKSQDLKPAIREMMLKRCRD